MSSTIATVVIPALNSAATLRDTLNAVNNQQSRERLRVVVVDNGSTDESLEIARALADATCQTLLPGTAAARNCGLETVRTPLMLSLDSDCTPVSPDWAGHHIDALERAHADVLGSAGRTIPRWTEDRWAMRADVTPHPAFAEGRPLYAVGGNGCFRTDALRALGGFPHVSADDAALGLIARRRGYAFVWTPESVVEHANAAGWHGYARQMRKVGEYAVEVGGRPDSSRQYLAGRVRQLLGAAKYLLKGDPHEALAAATRTVAQAVGARRAWRRGLHLEVERHYVRYRP